MIPWHLQTLFVASGLLQLEQKNISVVIAVIVSPFSIESSRSTTGEEKVQMFRSKEIDTIINSDVYDSYNDIYFFKMI